MVELVAVVTVVEVAVVSVVVVCVVTVVVVAVVMVELVSVVTVVEVAVVSVVVVCVVTVVVVAVVMVVVVSVVTVVVVAVVLVLVVVAVVVAVDVAVVMSQPWNVSARYASSASLKESAMTWHASALIAATCKCRKLEHVMLGTTGFTGPVNCSTMLDIAAAVLLQLLSPPKSERMLNLLTPFVIASHLSFP
jgi:hypothetical protein